jgi:hypothetical protein
MTELDLQQYKYRRNFPYNNTIKEESDENLSENKSTRTFNSIHPKRLLNKVLMRQVNKREYEKTKHMYNKNMIQTFELPKETDKYFNMKSEHIIRNFNTEQINDDIIHVEDLGNEFGKQASERYIKSSEKMFEESTNKVGSISSS